MNAIKIELLNKFFGKKQVLFDIELEFPKGQMTALLGPSGSGKSTLLRHINALTVASSGNIEIFGSTIQNYGAIVKSARVQRSKIGFIFQQFNLVTRLSVLDNVLIGNLSRVPFWRSVCKFFTKEEKEKALSCLERVGLKDLAYQRASTLSGGQQQRVAIAKVLMQEADIILADEPIASLDPESARSVMQALRDINEKDGKTVIVTLHQVDYARQYCQYVAALKSGHVRYYGEMELLSDEFLENLYASVPQKTQRKEIPCASILDLQLS
ncbi:phosphonate ABC transporter ATP-binding protein [Ignatzschineria rhizosphaerae]|uniref:Phosphonate ABC transporter ATP-binding protein n=1 Tax=Ignatzschineria rhizosphaerae TaxID=2923279 RepID=A0ABY3WWF0_9GAMM|nr:phosphonate ABC transporter ATP-binding protein [Ignatzschineria rhizosphaerae]UNM94948.1 phosphonate ABC transporter ATP-binding protein [Ignatzschineria rhizosphaerae]